MTLVTATPGLAPDRNLPGRDVLLDAVAVADRLPGLLDPDGTLGIDGCTRVRVKYRVEESLRVVYRLAAGGEEHLVAARAFRPGRSRAAYERACSVDTTWSRGALRPVAHDAGLEAVWWSFPLDRRLGELRWLLEPDKDLAQRVQLPAWRRSDVVQYVPERLVTVRALGPDGATLAYGKAAGTGAVPPSVAAARLDHLSGTLQRVPDPVAVPRCLGCSDEHGLLLMEAMAGEPWSALSGPLLAQGMSALGIAMARLHGCPPINGLAAFGRLRTDRVRHSAAIVGRARPDVVHQVVRVAERLRTAVPDKEPHVVLHGDCHPGNALLAGDAVALIDLDQMGHGPAAADLGSLIARLRFGAVVGELDETEAAELESRFLTGYGRRRPLPHAGSLAWHTAAALLAERALRVVNRMHGPGLARLAEVVQAADEVLDHGVRR